ncbi:MAG: hypothetical protein OEV49_12905 [candidate division Zixibacteria bacterium]|nr:hypothetical protein [candidate division Zixibacteria bacterium]MDH3937896.1 hypothetical protein [candidate division Zixibacteria bacterium]MDH4034064.1 hypothetical protein [candidate division Zixibacteria bacterium]
MSYKSPVWLLMTIVLLGLSSLSVSANDDSLFVPSLGARSQGMGGTGVASTYDLSPAFGNPALLALGSPWNTALSFRHPSRRVQDFSLYANGQCPRKEYTWGVGLDAVKASRRMWPGRTSAVRNWRIQGTMAVARRVYDELVAGIALKPARWRLYGEKSTSLEADLGLAYPTRWRDVDFVVGAVVRDLLGSEVTRRDHDTALDVSALLGVAGRYFADDSLWEFSAAVNLEAVERDFVADPQGRFRIGGEAATHRWEGYRLAGRLGHDGEHFTFGLGFGWRFLKVDWAKTAWTKWEHGQNLTVSIDPLGAREYLYELFGEKAPLVNWRDSIGVYRLEQFTHYDSSAKASSDAAYYDTTQYDETRILYHNARVFADDDDQIARADRGIANSEEALDRWKFVADSLIRETHLDSLLKAERNLTDSQHRELLSRADTCFRHRDYICALELIDMVLAKDSANPEALSLRSDVEQGRELEIVFSLVLADTAERENLLGRALEAYVHILYLDSLHEDGQTGKERVEERLAIRRFVDRAVRAYQAGQMAKASMAFDSAAALDPNLKGLQNILSGFNTNAADTTSLDVIRADTSAYRLYEQGLEFNRNQEYEKAIEVFNKVLKKYPNSPAVTKERDQALLMLQQAG